MGRIAALTAAIALASIACGGGSRPNILLVVADTARADRFLRSGDPAVSPRVAGLAREGAAYVEARTPAPWTVPAHASLFTGLYPSSHGAESGHLKIPDDAPFLAERLRRAGYRTQAYIANPWLGKEYNFHVGFDTFDEAWRAVQGVEGEMGAETIVGKIARWLDWRAGNDDAKAKPFFVFVNFFEPHLPYNPPEPERSRLLPPGAADREAERIERLRRFRHPDEIRAILGKIRFDADDLRILGALYDGEIAYTDRRIGELVDLLRARGLLDDTVVAVTSDHGEMLGEHGLFDHKLSLYEPVLRIPMVLRYPAKVQAGQRIAQPVMLQDLYPTLLALAGVDPGPSQEARRLPGIRGLEAGPVRGATLDDPLVAEFAQPTHFMPLLRKLDPEADVARWDVALVSFTYGTRKLVWSSGAPAVLYDLAEDPGESDPRPASGAQEAVASNRAADRAALLANPRPTPN